MNARRTWARIQRGSLDVPFRDLLRLAQAFGFELDRIRGSHHILTHPRLPALLNLQPDGNRAKPYQVRQLVAVVREHGLELED